MPPWLGSYSITSVSIVGIVFVVVFASTLSACSDSESPTSMMPLAIGNTWTYLEISGGQDSPVDSTLVTQWITGVENIEGYDYYLTNTLLSFDWASEGLSLAQVDRSNHSFFGFEMLLRFPIPSVPYEYTSTREPGSYFYIVPSEEKIETPAGHFHATTYRILRGDNHGFLFSISFAEGVGYVRLVNGLGTTWLLKSYDLVSLGGVIPYSATP